MVDNFVKSKGKQDKLTKLQEKKAELASKKLAKQVAALKIKELREGLKNQVLMNDDVATAPGQGGMVAQHTPTAEDPSLVVTPDQLASGISAVAAAPGITNDATVVAAPPDDVAPTDAAIAAGRVGQGGGLRTASHNAWQNVVTGEGHQISGQQVTGTIPPSTGFQNPPQQPGITPQQPGIAPTQPGIAPAQTATALVDTIPPTISIDAISTDNVINAQEHGQPLVITGKTDAENTETAVVTINGTDYKGAITNGVFTATVPATAVGKFTDGQHLNVTANVTDHAGNPSTPAHMLVTVDTSATISIDAISGDNVINATEHQQPLPISGTVAGVEDGQVVTVTLNGHNYDAVVSGGKWITTHPVPATDVKALA
ncbi:MAG: Ig-like domain-containing protein, partial [Psychromonas sp.]|nr:Ig-like domain-containing protein [Psychromonas sp.]